MGNKIFFKLEIINAHNIFSAMEISQMIIYQKKNVNNWIKNGVKRKKGY